MSSPDADPDEDLRELLQRSSPTTSERHDVAVLSAAREFARSPVPRPASSRAATGPRGRWWSARPSPLGGWALAASAAAIAVAVGFGWQSSRLRTELAQARAERAALTGTIGQLQGRIAELERAVPGIVSLLLNPGITRGSEELPQATVRADTRTLRVRLNVGAQTLPPACDVDLNTASGRHVWSAHLLAPCASTGGGSASIDVPAEVLTPGDYELALRSASPAASRTEPVYYEFRVRRE